MWSAYLSDDLSAVVCFGVFLKAKIKPALSSRLRVSAHVFAKTKPKMQNAKCKMKNEEFFEFLYTWTPSKYSVQQLAFFAAMIAMTLEKVEKRWQRSGRRRRRVVFGKAALGRGHQTLTLSSSLSSKIPIKMKTITITLQNPRAL